MVWKRADPAAAAKARARKRTAGNRPGSSLARTCENKMKFPSRKAAQAAMRRTKEQRGLTAASEAYACRFCGGWHWGHAKGTGRDRAADLLNRIDRALKADAEKRAARSQTTVDG